MLPACASEQGKVTGLVSLYIRERDNNLYVELQHAVPPTDTKFKPLLLQTQAGVPYTNTHKHRTSYLKSTLTFVGPAKCWKSNSTDRQKREILAFLHHQCNNNSNNFKISTLVILVLQKFKYFFT